MDTQRHNASDAGSKTACTGSFALGAMAFAIGCILWFTVADAVLVLAVFFRNNGLAEGLLALVLLLGMPALGLSFCVVATHWGPRTLALALVPVGISALAALRSLQPEWYIVVPKVLFFAGMMTFAALSPRLTTGQRRVRAAALARGTDTGGAESATTMRGRSGSPTEPEVQRHMERERAGGRAFTNGLAAWVILFGWFYFVLALTIPSSHPFKGLLYLLMMLGYCAWGYVFAAACRAWRTEQWRDMWWVLPVAILLFVAFFVVLAPTRYH